MIRWPVITCPKCGNKNEVALGQTACFRCGAELPEESESIDSDLAGSLSEKSNEELIGILASPADWRPAVINVARSELGRRSISTAQVEQKLAEDAKKKAEEFQKRSDVPLSFWDSVFTALCGAILGLFGLFFVWPLASRFRRDGYIMKSKKSWRLYWFAFCVRLAAVVILVIVAAITSH